MPPPKQRRRRVRDGPLPCRASRFHAITQELVETGDPVVPVTCRFLGLDPDQPIRADKVRELFRRYTDAIANDIGFDQAYLIGTALARSVRRAGMPHAHGQLLSDVESAYTLESWPKPYRTARLAPAGDPISMCAHLTLARSLADSGGRLDPDEVDPAAELAVLDGLQALGTAAGVPLLLPHVVEQWPDAAHFLRTEWDIGPLPPLTSPRRDRE